MVASLKGRWWRSCGRRRTVRRRFEGMIMKGYKWVKRLFSVKHRTGSWLRIRIRIRTSSSRRANQQAAPAAANSSPNELKGLCMMMQQLLQVQHVQAKALNQVTTDINTRMDDMFTELSTKIDAVSSHMKRIDIQIGQIAETVKRQQGNLPRKSVMNPRVE
ncbi:hypothetical protein F2Q69_00046124 [Brassica cretica]|uniref:Uncharacterized protein n=1 Tax=Brassica cretica TaxID=69181 RepID=A0A8S9Q7X5_BRACR|nr:hypothetical protein F2Q69_00046124 [Brassica cretica]